MQYDAPQGWASPARGRAPCPGGPEPRRTRGRRWRAALLATFSGSAPGGQDQQRNRIAGYAREDERAPRQWPCVRATSRHSDGTCNGAMRRFDRKRRREATQLAAVIVCVVVGVRRACRARAPAPADDERTEPLQPHRREFWASLAGEERLPVAVWARLDRSRRAARDYGRGQHSEQGCADADPQTATGPPLFSQPRDPRPSSIAAQ